MKNDEMIADAIQILVQVGLPRAQQNERSALCLLALINLTPEKKWRQSEAPLIGITPIMDWVRDHYNKDYASNSREAVRRKTIHQFVNTGIALRNPDDANRPVNSPKTVYQIETETLVLLKAYRTRAWKSQLASYLATHQTLTERYAGAREQNRIPVQIALGKKLRLSSGEHSSLIRNIIEEFAPRFVPDGRLVYVGDTGDKWGYFDDSMLRDELGVVIDTHGKMPDVVLYYPERNWLLLVEAVTSHGPVDGKRHQELAHLFAKSTAGLVYVTAFVNRAVMARYLPDIAWESEVWVADAPSHLIHFNGERFLGPY